MVSSLTQQTILVHNDCHEPSLNGADDVITGRKKNGIPWPQMARKHDHQVYLV